MMLPTHALAGMALALPFALAAPALGDVALAAGFAGGVLPDLDMYAGHRRTLHYPVYYPALALVGVAAAALAPGPVTVAAAFLLLGAALHSVSDVLGNGLELRPWEGNSDRAVYDHHRGRWLAPRRWVRYDGAPEDLVLSVALAVPLVAVLDGWPLWVVLASLAVAAGYAAVRRALPTVAEVVVGDLLAPSLPAWVRGRLPARYLDGEGARAGGGGSDGG